MKISSTIKADVLTKDSLYRLFIINFVTETSFLNYCQIIHYSLFIIHYSLFVFEINNAVLRHFNSFMFLIPFKGF